MMVADYRVDNGIRQLQARKQEGREICGDVKRLILCVFRSVTVNSFFQLN